MTNDKDPQGSPPPEPPAQEAAPGVSGLVDQEISLTITVLGPKLMVNGPLHDMVWCYGVLERAKDVIREMQRQQSPQGRTPGGLVVPPKGFKPPRG